MVERLQKHKQMEKKSIPEEGKNLELSKLFDKISKLYKEMPLDALDEWRSYSYNIGAARLKYLDFPVYNDEEVLRKLSNRKGFGQKFMRNIREFLNTGKCQLISEFEHDERRTSVRNMMRIWYVPIYIYN
jgi:DNA polymerase/3'-5' exonuclease PolX